MTCTTAKQVRWLLGYGSLLRPLAAVSCSVGDATDTATLTAIQLPPPPNCHCRWAKSPRIWWA